MYSLWDGVTLAIITGAISASAFLAYKHPKAYDRIATPILFLLLGSFFIAIIWNFVLQVALLVATDDIPSVSRDVVRGNIEAIKFSGTYFLVVIGTGAYLMFLSYLPDLLKADEEPNNKSGEENAKKDD